MKLLVIILFTSALLFPQGEHIYNDAFGFGFNYNYSASDRYSGNGFSGGLSILGKFDIAFDYVSSTIETNSVREIQASGMSLYCAYNLKPNLKTNLKFLAGYLTTSQNSYSSGNDGSGLILGLILAIKVVESESIIIMPGLGLGVEFISVGSNYNSKVMTASIVSLGIDFTSNFSDTFKIIITPSISKNFELSESPFAAGISIGFLITPPIDSSLDE